MASIARLSRLLLKQFTTASAPGAGQNWLYPKSDGNMYQMAPDGTERLVDDSHPVRVVAPGSITLSGTQTIDGVAVVAGDRVLPIAQGVFSGSGVDNGIWVVAAGAWSRATDADTVAKMVGLKVRPTEGRYAGRTLNSTMKATDTLGTTTVSFVLDEGFLYGNVFEQPFTNKGGEIFFDTQASILTINNGSGGVVIFPPGSIIEYAGLTAPTGFVMADGSAVSRTSFVTLLNAITSAAFTATGASGQKVVATATASVAYLGMTLDAPGISAGNKIANVTPGVSYTLTSNIVTTLSGTNNAKIYPWGNGDGTTTFNLPDKRGVTGVGVDGTTEFANLNTKFGEKTHLLTGAESGVQPHAHLIGAYTSANESPNFTLVTTGSSFRDRAMVNSPTGQSSNNSAAANATTAHNNIQPSVAMNYIVKT